jgi:hypothetical protein
MNKRLFAWAAFATMLSAVLQPPVFGGQYKNFTVSVYITVNDTRRMADPQWLADAWDRLSSQVKIDKVYIETFRNDQSVDEQTIEPIKKFFTDHGVQVAGGITFAPASGSQFRSFSYADPKDRATTKHQAEIVARHFDEVILDDFFFYNTKTDADIAAKGDRSWTQYRLDAMRDVARNLVVGPAKAVNPKVKMVIKFPNWYEHFQGLGYDLDQEPKIFDGIYTGTETRDPNLTDQHLQQYESYEIFRYFENIKPGGNGGGWIDTFSTAYVDRYAEQLWDTALAKAPEITLFNWSLIDSFPMRAGDRAAWQGLHTSFDYDAMLKYRQGPNPNFARVAGYSLDQVDGIVGKLGNPIGIASYKPYQSTGEDFLHNYLGMIGIPIDLRPTFPTDANVVLLTESAKFDPDIVAKIKGQLAAGKNVVITSGLLRALAGKGIEDIVELNYTGRTVAVRDFVAGFGAGNGTGLGNGQNPEILIPDIRFITNDAWQLVSAVANSTSCPILLMDRYSKGVLYVLTIPDNFGDLYNIPREAVTAIKRTLLRDFPVWLDAPNQVCSFAYDNHTFVIQSFLPTEANVRVQLAGGFTKLRDLATDQEISGQPAPVARFGRNGRADQGPARMVFSVQLQPHSYEAFIAER